MKPWAEASGDDVPKGSIEPKAIRVLLADSQGIYSFGIRKILGLEADILLIAHASSFEELRIAIQQNTTDVVLVDSEVLTACPASVSELQEISFGIKLIVQVASLDEEQTVEFYRRGIRGLISRAI